MKRAIIVALFASASVALAQQPAQRPSDDEINATIQFLRLQREQLADQVVQAQTQAARLARENEEMKKKAEACKPAEKK